MRSVTVTAFLLAFDTVVPIPTREIEIPAEEYESADQQTQLGLAFKYGQNDFQPKPRRSVSVGDAIRLLDGSLHRVRGIGWQTLPSNTDINSLERGTKACIFEGLPERSYPTLTQGHDEEV